jgi:hypothetical protein
LPEKLPPNRPEYNALVKLLSLGSGILGLAISGYFLDQKFHTLPLWTAAGIFLGVLYSFYEAWRIHRGEGP